VRTEHPRFVAAFCQALVAVGYAAVVGIFASYAPTLADLLTAPPTMTAVLLASFTVSVLLAALLFSPFPLGKNRRRWVLASAVLMALVNVGYVTFLFWPFALWPLWLFYREGAA
jgi:MFS family permease